MGIRTRSESLGTVEFSYIERQHGAPRNARTAPRFAPIRGGGHLARAELSSINATPDCPAASSFLAASASSTVLSCVYLPSLMCAICVLPSTASTAPGSLSCTAFIITLYRHWCYRYVPVALTRTPVIPLSLPPPCIEQLQWLPASPSSWISFAVSGFGATSAVSAPETFHIYCIFFCFLVFVFIYFIQRVA